MDVRLRVIGILGVCTLLYVLFFSAPWQFKGDVTVEIPSGSSVTDAAVLLQQEGALKYAFLFKLLAPGVQAGAYALPKRESAVSLAYRLSRGDTGLQSVRITIPEGVTIRDIEALLDISIPKEHEGYLFPDTYDFLPGSSAEVVISRMRERYEEKVEPLREKIAASGRTEHEIITMASLLQREARRHETMKTVAGILWNRIDIGMPLQVDAVFGYIFERPTYSPTHEDLEVESPYNTYKYKGLPPGPIANPGLDAIIAAIEPTPSDYLYYLTGKDGFMYYAKTFDEHVANRRFLR